MKNLIFVLVLISFLTACNKSEENGEYYSSSVDIYVQNSDGENILGDTYSLEEMTLYYEVDNKKVKVYNPNLDWVKGMKIYDIDNTKVLRVGLNTYNLKYPITYIKWNESDIDTIMNTWILTDDGLVSREDTVWYNGKRMLPDHRYGTLGGFKIMK